MTKAEKNKLIDDLEHIKNVLLYGHAKDAIFCIQTVLKTVNESTDYIDDWSDEIEARINRLEQRLAWHENNRR